MRDPQHLYPPTGAKVGDSLAASVTQLVVGLGRLTAHRRFCPGIGVGAAASRRCCRWETAQAVASAVAAALGTARVLSHTHVPVLPARCPRAKVNLQVTRRHHGGRSDKYLE